MPSATFTVTGSGKQSLGAGSITVLEVAATLISPGPLVQFAGPSGFRRVWHSCWYGVGYDNGASPPDWINWNVYQRLEREDYRLNGRNIFADSVFYDVTPGTTVELEVDW